MTTENTKFPFEEKIPVEAWEHMKAARDEMKKGLDAILPESYKEFHEHRKTAGKEVLLAWRSMIDEALKKMDEK